jgi:hypothetical protein
MEVRIIGSIIMEVDIFEKDNSNICAALSQR